MIVPNVSLPFFKPSSHITSALSVITGSSGRDVCKGFKINKWEVRMSVIGAAVSFGELTSLTPPPLCARCQGKLDSCPTLSGTVPFCSTFFRY